MGEPTAILLAQRLRLRQQKSAISRSLAARDEQIGALSQSYADASIGDGVAARRRKAMSIESVCADSRRDGVHTFVWWAGLIALGVLLGICFTIVPGSIWHRVLTS